MRHLIATLSFAALSLVAAAAPPYTVLDLPVPNHDWLNQGIIAVSRHGTYFITEAYSPKSDQYHYLLYGPNSTTKFQDLSGAAGPLGQDTGGQLWPSGFFLVNDKGTTVTYGGESYALYDHETHQLRSLPMGFYPQVLNNRNNVAGSISTYSPKTGYLYDDFARWDSKNDQLKTINPYPSFDWYHYDYPGLYASYQGANTDLSDTDEQVGYAYGIDASGQETGNFGFEYLVGDADLLTYGSDYYGHYEIGYDAVYGINDNHQTTGFGFFKNRSGTVYQGAFLGDLNGNKTLLKSPYGESVGYSVDNLGEVFGLTFQDSAGYGIWDVNGTPHSLTTLTGSPFSSESGYFVTNPFFDMSGTVYGTWFSYSDSKYHLLVISKTTS